MKITLEEIKKKVPTAHHIPLKDCKYCHGTGFRHKKLPGGKFLRPFEGDFPCICIFVDHDLVYKAQEMINETIDNIRNGK